MPTSAPGSPEPLAPRQRQTHSGTQRGFTLLELLVVVSLVALATAGVSLALPDPAATQLEREAQRLTALLEAGRAQAFDGDRPVHQLRVAEEIGKSLGDGIDRDIEASDHMVLDHCCRYHKLLRLLIAFRQTVDLQALILELEGIENLPCDVFANV